MRTNSIRHFFLRLLIVFAGLIFALVMAELFILSTNLDWDFAKKNLYFQDVDLPSHIPVSDAELLYRLKPNSQQKYTGCYGQYTVTINSHGARGPERPKLKPSGVFRIICFGGSNVYGESVNDHETWPAQLEKWLNLKNPGKYEVWNFGTSAYVGIQIVRLAEEAIEKYDPDLVIIALSNTGAAPLLQGTQLESLCQTNPSFWQHLISPQIYNSTSILSPKNRDWLFKNIGLFRFISLGISAMIKDEKPDFWDDEKHGKEVPLWLTPKEKIEEKNIASIRGLLKNPPNNKSICVFIGPYSGCFPGECEGFYQYYKDIDIPVFILNQVNLSREYQKWHPPPEVLAWYGESIAEWILSNRLNN